MPAFKAMAERLKALCKWKWAEGLPGGRPGKASLTLILKK